MLTGNYLVIISFIFWSLPVKTAQYDSDKTENDINWTYTGDKTQKKSDVIFFDDRTILAEGDYCYNANKGVEGVCKLANNCPDVLNDFRNKGIKPVICSYLANDIVVCCPPTQNADSIDFNSFDQSSIRKSEQKCEEYSKLAASEAAFTVLTIQTTVHQISIPICDYSTGLIVGGEIAKHGEFPHMAAIGWTQNDNTVNWNCGGSLISDYFIVTAGHCHSLYGIYPDIIRLGAQKLKNWDSKSPPKDIRIEKVIPHPKYKRSSHYNDIALIKMVEKVRFTKTIRPACLWQNYNVNVSQAIASGWGQTEYAGDRSDDLLKVSLDIVENNFCNSLYGPMPRLRQGITDSQICAGFLEGGKDTCQGDSGGPIQVTTSQNTCVFHIVGVTSFGKACAARNTVGVYTRISYFLDWIESVVWP